MKPAWRVMKAQLLGEDGGRTSFRCSITRASNRGNGLLIGIPEVVPLSWGSKNTRPPGTSSHGGLPDQAIRRVGRLAFVDAAGGESSQLNRAASRRMKVTHHMTRWVQSRV